MIKINSTDNPNNIELFKIVSKTNNDVCILDTYTLISTFLVILLISLILLFLKRKVVINRI
jgi:hypothetical protein